MAASVLFVFAFLKGFGHVVRVFFAIFEPKINKIERVRRELDARNIATNKIDVAIFLIVLFAFLIVGVPDIRWR